MADTVEMCTCQKCAKTMKADQFYTYKDGRKTELCKKCLTMHVNNFDEHTYLWILEKLDVPYIPEEWNVLRDRAYAKNPAGMTGMSVIGKYLSKMKLKQWKDYCWADGPRLCAENQEKVEKAKANQEKFEDEIKEQYERGEITEAEYKTLVSTETLRENEPYYNGPIQQPQAGNNFNENNFISEDTLVDFSKELSEEDKLYLAMKWGRLYKPNEWIELEKKYVEMEQGFDIQDPDTKNALILICKTNLKLNQAIDCGDMDGFTKLSRTYDSLRKSTKFTAAQNKSETNNFVDSVGELVAYCEHEGGQIPKFNIETPQDIIDTEIKDLKDYTKSLVYQDTALAQQIENYLKQRIAADERKQDLAAAKEKGLDKPELENEDYEQYFNQMFDELNQDKNIFEGSE